MFSDQDRAEAFTLIEILTLSGKWNSWSDISDVFRLRWSAGPTFWIPTEARDEIDDEMLFDYAIIGELKQDLFSLGAGITGRSNITGDIDDFSDRFIHHLGINASYLFDNLQPGIHLRVPIQGELDDIYNHVFGLNLMYRL